MLVSSAVSSGGGWWTVARDLGPLIGFPQGRSSYDSEVSFGFPSAFTALSSFSPLLSPVSVFLFSSFSLSVPPSSLPFTSRQGLTMLAFIIISAKGSFPAPGSQALPALAIAGGLYSSFPPNSARFCVHDSCSL